MCHNCREGAHAELPHERLKPVVATSWSFIEALTATSPPNIALNGGPAVAISFGAVDTFVASGANPGDAPNVASTCVIICARQPAATAMATVTVGDRQH